MNGPNSENPMADSYAGRARWRLLSLSLLLGALAYQQADALTINVVDAKDNSPINSFKYLINVDNTGVTDQRDPLPGSGCAATDPDYPRSCKWTSSGVQNGAWAPIYTQGDNTNVPATIDNGRYLVSVSVEGYKVGGSHFKVAGNPDQTVTVKLDKNPLIPAQIQALVFSDISPANSAYDAPLEPGLAGFQAHIADYIAEVTTDVFGNPLCTEYQKDAAGVVELDGEGAPVVSKIGGQCLSKCYIVDNGIDKGELAPNNLGQCPTDVPTNAAALDAALYPEWKGKALGAAPAVQGKVKIPNLGPGRYGLAVTPPNASDWIQTTTLEGMHEWDAWVMENSTGLDTEFVIGAEPLPQITFGYVPGPANSQTPAPLNGAGVVKGTVKAVKVYVPTVGGITLPGTIWGGMAGAKIDPDQPWSKHRPDGKLRQNPNTVWATLSDLSNGDTVVAVTAADENGAFQFSGVPDGTYTLTYWDEQQNFILDLVNVTVRNGETVDTGILPLTGWWTKISGYVFEDSNANGKKDPGERGLAGYPLVSKKRENSVADRGAKVVTTDADGYYEMVNAYPMTQFEIIEAYDDLHKTTGVTYQPDNAPEKTVLGSGVDISYLPIIGLSGRLDWGKQTYANGTNGGIVGSISYDTTRNELDPAYAAVENWQPGIPELHVNLYKPVPVAPGTDCEFDPTVRCDASGRFELDTDGSIKKGPLLNQYITETWQPATGCTARDVDGNVLVNGLTNPAGAQQVLPPAQDVPGNTAPCLEGPLVGVQFDTYWNGETDPALSEFGASVNGNYGFGDGCFGPGNYFDPATGSCAIGELTTMAPGDYIVEVEIPKDGFGRPMLQVTKEEDINVFTGDSYIPQAGVSACAGPLHTVDVEGIGADGYPAIDNLDNGLKVPASTPVHNPDFVGEGGSPYEGTQKPLCTAKLIRLDNKRSIAPGFNFFTEVPLPGRMWGLLVDDLNFSVDPKSLTYGEKAGVPFAPVGIYDWKNSLVTTVETDYNGLYDVLLPSSNRISCPTPSGYCFNVYHFVGNDPGVPGRLNPNYQPAFRTIAADFESGAGLLVPADNAPTQAGVTVQLPGGQNFQPLSCPVETTRPQIFAVDKPYSTPGQQNTVVIKGIGFGSTKGTGSVSLSTPGGTTTTLATTAWSDTSITASISGPVGPRQLMVTRSNGLSTINGLTYHVRGNGYNPTVFEVGPGRTYAPAPFDANTPDHTIQRALDDAAGVAQALVVVYPNIPTTDPRVNPRGAYYENPIIHSPVKLQGVGPGGIYADGTSIPGAILDGGAVFGDTQSLTDWNDKITALQATGIAGNQVVNEGEVIYVVAQSTDQYTSGFRGGVDGFDIRGGNEVGFPGNLNQIGGTPTGLPANVVTQAGAVFVNDYAHYFQITNNVVQNNSGAYGTIRVGTPNLSTPTGANRNDHVLIANNRIIANAGTNLAGGIGIFEGSNDYEIARNDICGNFSAEYGGGISVYGLSYNPAVANSRGLIHHNRIYSNRSFDEGGGIMIAGELPTNPADLSPGAGPVDIYNNLIQANFGNDDGGGLRFLMAASDCDAATAGVQPCSINVYNNMIVNNVSTHEGGGVALNDAPNVRIYNNTIMKNITTATAMTSNGQPAPAGISTSQNSVQLNAQLSGFTSWSNPILFNNIVSGNLAGTRNLTGTGPMVTGVGQPGDLSGLNYWDTGNADVPGNSMTSVNSIVGAANASSPAMGIVPRIAVPYDVTLAFNPWRNNPGVIGALLVAFDAPPTEMGDYHLIAGSPAINAGTGSSGGVNAPAQDYDNQNRTGNPDVGADEFTAGGVGGNTANLSITKTDGVTKVAVGDPITYTITASNAGPAGVRGAIVTDNFPAGFTVSGWHCTAQGSGICPAGSFSGNLSVPVTLMAGDSVTFTVAGTVSNAVSCAAGLSNTATVTVPAGVTDTAPGNNSATDTDAIDCPAADLAITKTDGTDRVAPGQQLTYAIVVTNNGLIDVTGATVRDIPPSRLNGVTWTCGNETLNAQCSVASGNGSINNVLVNLPANASVTFNLTGTVGNGGSNTLSNTATVTVPAGVTDPAAGNNSASDTDAVGLGADLSITKTDSATTTFLNGLDTYVIVVSNAGPSTANGALVNDVLPVGFNGATWTCTSVPGSSCLGNNAGNGNISNVPVFLPANGSVTFRLTGRPTQLGQLVNTATVTAPASVADLNQTNNSATDNDTNVVAVALPTLSLLDDFTRPDATNLGGNWIQPNPTNPRVVGTQATSNNAINRWAFWNAGTFGAQQGASVALTSANAGSRNNVGVLLKANGGPSFGAYTNFVRVRYQTANGGRVQVTVTQDGGNTLAFSAFLNGVTFAQNDVLTATIDAAGVVQVFKTSAGVSTFVGSVALPTATYPWTTGGGAIGFFLPGGAGSTVDNFTGGNF